MVSKRGRSALLLAISLSLLLHLFVAGLIRWPFGLQREKPEYVSLSTREILTLTHATPSPRPPVRHLPHPLPARVAKPARSRARIRMPSKIAVAPAGGGTKRAAVPTGSPSPLPTAVPSRPPCSVPDAPPGVLQLPPPPEIAPEARAAGTSGITSIRVTLDRNARVTAATVVGTSGSGDLDMVALQMARDSVYAPRYVNCAAVPGTYTFTVKFVAW
ncbi:MAG: energy transducer TonB [Firmicutes bacterium]|nr:energy transducer TonB [Bacillota bacterium]